MNDKLFDELVESVREGAGILKGKAPASRAFHVGPADVKRIRNRYRLSQDHFAAMIGISAATLKNWEQGRREPAGPARVLLQVAEKRPDALLEVVAPIPRRRK